MVPAINYRRGSKWAQLWGRQSQPYLSPGRSLSHDGSVTAAALRSSMMLGREKLFQFFTSPYGEVGSGESSRLLPQVMHKDPVL